MTAQHLNGSLAGGPLPPGILFPFEGAIGGSGNHSLEQEGGPRLVLPTFSPAACARVAVTLVLCVVATACNVAVLWAGLARGHAKRSQARVLLLHLAGADLLVALVVMPLDAAWNITLQWRAGDWACRLLMFLKLLAMYASAFLTAIIGLDRQAAILRPLAIAEGWRRNRVLLQAAWMLSAGLSIPQLFLFRTVTIASPQNFTQCTTRGSFARPWHEAAYNLFTFLCLFLLPLAVMLACYARILMEISRRLRSCSGNGAGGASARELPLRRSRNPIPRARLRMLGLSVAIVGSFVVCWTPYYLLGFWYWFWPEAMEGSVSPSLAHLLFAFGLLNACLDPITYGLFVGGCCGAAGGPRTQTPSPATGSFRCSAASLRLRQGPAPQPDVAPAPGTTTTPSAPWAGHPTDSSHL
ncbi:putative gonadotropin-releasing hormone II receptor [Sceloporus undulatus]|uniref:putative gonadotropin-releasing hormone II receptor n=1 Tax=Sceloporus undulatus TaxID=8520 RepID=UPI001C4D7C10|nr:putative gonadotropin-releasing hormone II receptor [Sceloporus undulatus]